MGPRRVDFRCLSEKRDFLEIELSMVIWPHFEGRTLPKLSPHRCEKRLPCATAEKTGKNGRRDPLFRPRARFWSILGSRLGPRMASLGRLSADFGPTFATFWATVGSHVVFLRSRVLGEGAGLDLGRSRDHPGMNFGTIFGDSLRRVVHSWRPWFCSKFVHILPKVRSVCCPSLAFASNSPCPSVGGRRSPRSGLNKITRRTDGPQFVSACCASVLSRVALPGPPPPATRTTSRNRPKPPETIDIFY